MNLPTAIIEKVCLQRSNIAAYIDGELSPRDELELEMHLAVCKECKRELNEQKKLLLVLNSALKNEDEIEMPVNFTRVVVANAESKVSGLRRPQERFKALFVCAALFLLVLFGLGGETLTIVGAFGKFAEQFLAVGGFLWNLIYDAAFGVAIVLRSLSQQIVFNSHFSVAVLLLGLVFVCFMALSRLAARLTRP